MAKKRSPPTPKYVAAGTQTIPSDFLLGTGTPLGPESEVASSVARSIVGDRPAKLQSIVGGTSSAVDMPPQSVAAASRAAETGAVCQKTEVADVAKAAAEPGVATSLTEPIPGAAASSVAQTWAALVDKHIEKIEKILATWPRYSLWVPIFLLLLTVAFFDTSRQTLRTVKDLNSAIAKVMLFLGFGFYIDSAIFWARSHKCQVALKIVLGTVCLITSYLFLLFC